EIVEWVSTVGHVVCPVPRAMVLKQNLLHRGIGVLVRDAEGRIYCHRRAAAK
ncbi:unnamed protein product, partial [Phaeothamnion confervicola]